MPLDGQRRLLEGWRVRAVGRQDGVAVCGARALAWLGVTTIEERGQEELLELGGCGCARVRITGWEGERAARARCGLAAIERAAGDAAAIGPRGMVVTQYLGTLAAAAALRRASAARSLASVGSDGGLAFDGAALARGVVEGIDPAATTPAATLRCADGWLVARWRHPSERQLLAAVLAADGLDPHASDGLDLRGCGVEAVWAAARACRLLAAPVRLPGGPSEPALLDAPRPPQPADSQPVGRGRLRVVDWTPLWAGPWATGKLADQGHLVTRIEPPARRDGLLRTAHGRACWRRWNGAKSLALLDAREPGGRRALGALVAGSHVLVTGMTPRVLPQLGLDDEWFARNAPHPLRVELVGFDEPNQDLPAVGEQTAAVAGLLSPEHPDRPPFPPLPWPDPLLGANCLVAIRAWEAAGRPPGVRIRLSLESAARSALVAPSALAARNTVRAGPEAAGAAVNPPAAGAR
jgi:hypothetical protein